MRNLRVKFIVVLSTLLLAVACKGAAAETVLAVSWDDLVPEGFVVPLEGTETLTTEFLLVPYFGACIHVPPPPSNQIVYVKFEKGIPIDNIYDAIWVTGTLSTDGWQGDIASVGYRLSGESIEMF